LGLSGFAAAGSFDETAAVRVFPVKEEVGPAEAEHTIGVEHIVQLQIGVFTAIPGYPGNAIIVQFLQIAFVNFYKQSFGKSLVIMKFQHLS
jgi:hypothetical protein